MMTLLLPVLAGAMGAAPAPAAPQEPVEARIPFAHMIRDYRPDGREAIYVRTGKQWYRGTFFAPCDELPWTQGVRFVNRGGLSGVDKFSTVIVRGERCDLSSLVKIDGKPPEKAKG